MSDAIGHHDHGHSSTPTEHRRYCRIVFVKICGITHPDDARTAAAASVDAIGLNFVPTSRRCIDLDTARAIVDAIPDHVIAVGIFQHHALLEILEILGVVGLEAAQLHGDHSPDVIDAIRANGQTVITVVVAGRGTIDLRGAADADIVMVDAPNPGNGVPFDWDLVGDLGTKRKILLAGGLRPDNVSDAIRRVRPWGVDVATGVETPCGRKDPNAIARFVAAARAAMP